ncbi:DUF2514 family protein [Pandoraea sp. SD6-2]|uniref:DUF2514 family protein n=1 Tax=Pandoraea sp. SD6-2 TaxID=1286093 RepID=UPI00039BD74D|nr:DUF2514 family protein [Pandoraea sp. SD6-2]
MTWLSPRVWGVCLLAVSLGIAGGYWKGHRDADQSAKVAMLEKTAKELAAERDEYRERVQTQAGITNDAKQSADKARDDARAATAASDQLRRRVAELVTVARHSTAADGSAPAADPIGVLADVLGRADERAGKLAEFADAAHIAGLACERSYDALNAGMR